MMALVVLLAALADTPSALTAVRLESADAWPVVRLVLSGPSVPAQVERVGHEVVVVLPGVTISEGVSLPEPLAEVTSLAFEEAASGVRLRIGLEGDQAYELRQDPGGVSILIRPAPAAASPPVPAPPAVSAAAPAPAVAASPHPVADVRDLYAKIVPPALTPATAEATTGAPEGSGMNTRPEEGLQLGFLHLRPSVVMSYVDADSTFLDTPQPVHARYFQIEPHLGFGLGARIPLPGNGNLLFTYEPRFRVGTTFAELKHPTHLATLALDVPVGHAVTLRASHHYARGVLETSEVDPGREYFFRLAPFVRNESAASVTFNSGGLLALDLTARRDAVRIDDNAGFFDHRTDTVGANLAYEIGTTSHAYVRYQLDRVPTPSERPLAELRGTSVLVGVTGDVLPLVTGEAAIGYRSLTAPRASGAGRSFHGTIGLLRLKKEFTPSSSLSANAQRETYPSAFEDNAFYVSTGAALALDYGLPLSVVSRIGVGWQRNDYRVPSASIGVPRQDDIVGWSVGVGRSLTRWAFLRVDYRRDHRRSNLKLFQNTGHVFMVEFGVGYLDATPNAEFTR